MPHVKALVLLCLVLVACSDGPKPPVSSVDERVTFQPQEVRFGDVVVGGSWARRVEVRNEGKARISLRLASLPVGFEVEPEELGLETGETEEFLVRFRPTEAREYEGRIEFRAKDVHALPVLGRGVDRALRVDPETVEFGEVEVGTEATATLELTNTADGELNVLLTLGGSEDFSVERERLRLSGGRSAVVPVRFAPSIRGAYAAWLDLSPCSGCAHVRVNLWGKGVVAAVTAAPKDLDFGTVPPGFEGRRQVVFTSSGELPATLGTPRLVPGDAPFRILNESIPSRLEPGESVEVDVAFAPADSEEYEANLEIDTGRETLRIPLAGKGGGPILRADPLDLGLWPLGFEVENEVTLRNEGETTTFRILDVRLDEVEGPFSLAPLSLPMDVSGAAWSLPIRFQATEVGHHRATVAITTSLAFQPNLEIPVEARVPAPDCDLEIDPPSVRLGLVDGALAHPLSFELRHRGEGECYVWDVRFEGEADAFRIDGGATTGFRRLEPGEVHRVEAELLPLGRQIDSRLVESRLRVHHSRLGLWKDAEVSAAPWLPFPLQVEGPEFPTTPLGKATFAFLSLEIPDTNTWPTSILPSTPELRVAGPALWSGQPRTATYPMLFEPTAVGARDATLEIWLHDFPEPHFLEVPLVATPSCAEPCDWPTIECRGWEIIDRPFPQPPQVTSFAQPSSEALECLWLLHASPTPVYLTPIDGCHSASGGAEEGVTLEVIARDASGRAATCTQTYVPD